MTELNNNEYYRRRAEHSRELAENAANPNIARIHLEMAARYDELAAATSSEPDEHRMASNP
jgi:hypothetical protein